jgi:hypothetical protein
MSRHIVVHDGTAGRPPLSLSCLICQATLAPSVPLPAAEWLDYARAFWKEHRRCRRPVRCARCGGLIPVTSADRYRVHRFADLRRAGLRCPNSGQPVKGTTE